MARTTIQRLHLDAVRDPMFRQAMNLWNETVSGPGIVAGAKALNAICDEATNLFHSDMNASSVLAYRIRTLRQAFDLQQTRGEEIGNYPDLDYVSSVLEPNYAVLAAQETPAFRRIMTPIQGRFAVYEGLWLPYNDYSGRQALTLSRLLFLAEDVDAKDAVALTERERECLFHLAAGGSAKRISAALGISSRTVEHHVESIRKKLGVHNVSHAVAKDIVLSLANDCGEAKPFSGEDAARLFSQRERRCLGMLASGRSAHEIADELGESEKAVERLITSLKRRLGARNAAELTAIGVRITLGVAAKCGGIRY